MTTPRSPYEKLAGAYHLGRITDKARLFLADKLPRDYRVVFGNRRALDGQFLAHFCLTKRDFLNIVETHLDDEAIEVWFLSEQTRADDVDSWNAIAPKMGLPGEPMHDEFENFGRKVFGIDDQLPKICGVFQAICIDEGHELPQ